MNKPGMLLVYSGPSGVGKGTLLVPYLHTHPGAVLSVSMTTRSPRPGEIDGVEYYFVSRAQFLEKIEAGGFLEYAEYNGNFYGTPRSKVEALLAQGTNVFLEIEVQGAMQVKRSYPEAVFIFVLPPTRESLRERLLGRGTEAPQEVEKRFQAADTELKCALEYDYLLVNDDPDAARGRLASIVEVAGFQTRFMKNTLEKVCTLV